MEIRATAKLQASKALEQEVMKKCLWIKKQIDEVREKIAGEFDTPQNFNGCLHGQIKDYLEGFDKEIVKLERAFDKNHSHWTTQVKEAKNFDRLRGAEMTAASQQIKR